MGFKDKVNGLFTKNDRKVKADMTEFEDDNGGYVFISHSHKDIKKVSQLRNMLEDSGFEPLCFFLKCLTDDDEVEGLIKREIDAREWFVYVDSPNSRASRWVKKERDYIESVGNKKVINVDLDSDMSIESISKILSRGLTIFVSYSIKDKDFVWPLYERLVEREFQVFCPPFSIESGSTTISEMVGGIETACELGLILAVISESSIESNYVKTEIDIAFGNNGMIVPVYLGDVRDNLPGDLGFYLGNVEGIEVKGKITEEAIDDTAEQIAVIARNIIQSELDRLS